MTPQLPTRRALLQAAVLTGFVFGTGAVAGCSGRATDHGGRADDGDGDIARSDVERVAMSTGHTSAATMLGAFAGDLLREALDRSTGNVILSPWSITVAMAMNRAGAAGTTATQIDEALHVPRQPAEALDASLNTAALILDSHNRTYDSGSRKGEVVLRSANSTWARPDVPWRPAYLDTLAKYYGAGVKLTDFGGDPEGSRERINAWVADHTQDRIDQLVPTGVITPLTALAVVNAVYLEAPWAQDFPTSQSADGAFTLEDGTSKQVPMMHASLAGAARLSGAGYEAVRLPYLGGTLAMTAILPATGQQAGVGKWLAGGGITEVLRAGGTPDVQVTMPRFAFRSTLDLKGVLLALGITDAFDPKRADYTGAADRDDLYLSAALHQATIEVDEQGTVATAATAVVLSTVSAPGNPQVVVLDRPFYFVIHDVETRVPVFVGRVVDPTGAS